MTTNDNIKIYLEDQKNMNQMPQPKFFTSTLQPVQKIDNQQLNTLEPKQVTKEATEEIDTKQIQLKEEIKEDEKSEVDSDVDVFV